MDMPAQVSSNPARTTPTATTASGFDPREQLTPRRLTLAMWDQAFLLRHGPGGSFADWDRVLDETIERGYNTVRLDPMPQWIDLSQPDRAAQPRDWRGARLWCVPPQSSARC